MEGEHYSMSNVAVYAKGSTDFTTQGLGILADIESSKTTQTVSDSGNVTSQLELEYPVKGLLVDKLIEGNFIRVSMAIDSSKYMVYEISDTLKDDSGIITVYADPYSDRIGRMSFENGGKFGKYNSVQAALNYAKSQMKDFPSAFQLTSNISKSVDFTKDGIIPNFKKFLDLLNTKVSGNVYYGLNIIQIYSALGKDRSDIILRDDRNTASVKVKTDYSSIINRIIPVLPVLDKDGNATQETKVGTPVISKTPNQFIDYWSASAIQLDTQELANTYFDRTHADRPVQTVDVDPLSMSEDFSDIDIFDRVQIYSSRLNYTDKLRVSSRVIDNLTGQVTKFSLGNSSVSIYNTIEGQKQSVLNQIQAITSVVISASGKNQTYVSNIQPTSANEGDMWIQEDGDYKAFWVYKDGDWVRLVDSDTQKAITDGVAAAIEQAKLDTKGLVDSNNAVIRSEMQTVATQKAKDEIAKGNFNATAQAYANSAQSTAIAQAKSLVSTQAQQAAKDLSDARLSIKNDINTATNAAVASANSQAQTYVNQAKTDINDTINALSAGGRNYLIGTVNANSTVGANANNQSKALYKITLSSLDALYKEFKKTSDYFTLIFDWEYTGTNPSGQFIPQWNIEPWGIGGHYTVISSNNTSGTVILTASINSNWSGITATPYMGVRFDNVPTTGTVTISNMRLMPGNIAYPYTQAPEDIVLDYTTKDNQIKETITQYKETNDGKVTKAQTDATTALGLVETKVSKTDYNTKTGELTKSISDVKQTADSYAQVIANIHTADGKQDARMSEIENTASGLKSTVSALSTTQGTQSGYISELQQSAKGWDATATKVDNLAIGGRNYVLNSDVSTTSNITNFKTSIPVSNFSGKIITVSVQVDYDNITELPSSSIFNRIMFEPAAKDGKTGNTRYFGTSITPQIGDSFHGRISATYDLTNVNIIGFYTGENVNTWGQGIYVQGVVGTNVSVSRPKIEISTIATDYTQAPEDLSAASAQAQLTADNAALDLKNYKISNDGSVRKAQSDIQVVAGKVETKVSQVDYDSNNKTLNQNISTATQTATEAKTAINNYKTTTDGTIHTMSGQIDTVAGGVQLAATKSELNTAKSEFKSQVSTVQADYKSVTQSVTEVKGALNDLQQVNLINNSDFSPDLGGWTTRGAGNFTTGDYDYAGGVYIVESTSGGLARTNSAPIPLNGSGSKAYSLSFNAYIFSLPSGGRVVFQLTFLDANLNETSNIYPGYTELGPKGTGNWFNIKLNNIVFTPPTGAEYIVFSFDARGMGTKAGFNKPIVVSGSSVGSYVRGQYSNNDKIALQQITIDSISDVVSNPTTGLSRRVQTAEGFLTQVRGTDIPALQKATFWQPYSSLNFNDYTKQGSFFFNTTSAKTNGPVSWNNSWLYLMVEQGTSGDGRIKQTAWYDGVDGVKITYVRTLNSGTWSPWYANDNDSVATISVMNGQISQEISDRKSGDSNTLTQSKSYTESQITSAVSGINSTISQTASAILANISATNLFIDSEFNQDYGARSKSGTVTYLANQNVDNQYHGVVRVVTTTDSYQGYWGKNIPVQGGAKYSGSVRVHFNNNGISSGFALYDLWFVKKDGSRISTGASPSYINLKTYAVSSPYWVDLWVDGVTAPTDAVYAQISLLATGGTGMVADFTMPTFTATDVHQPYSPNDDVTTQLALLKDKWSIGIADNIGNIVSGIAGNSSQMSIISDKVIIKSPNTQITGTAWIKTAMIADGQIGTAQIGDASITSAKILSLDVSKISGNISNFILSQWTSATGSNVTIDGNGIYFAPGTSRMTRNGFEAWRYDVGQYRAMGMVGSYSWESDKNLNGMGLIAKYYDQEHNDSGDPYRNENWGADTIAIGALMPEIGRGYNYVDPFLIFPANGGVGNKYFPGNGNDTIIMGRWLSIYTGLNMRGHAITNSSGYSLKENFGSVSGDDALEIFDNTDILTYDYKPDSNSMDNQTIAGMKNKVGFVINDNGKSPYITDSRLVRYGNTRDDSVTVGYLMAAVKELHEKVKKLESLNEQVGD